MHKLATLFRAAQLMGQRFHNLAKGPSFFSDHAALANFYEAYESAYDDLVERMIGTGQNPDIAKINSDACEMFQQTTVLKTNDEFFSRLLKSEGEFCREIAIGVKSGCSEGTCNLLQDLADQSEKRQYLIKHRVAK